MESLHSETPPPNHAGAVGRELGGRGERNGVRRHGEEDEREKLGEGNHLCTEVWAVKTSTRAWGGELEPVEIRIMSRLK